MKVSHLFLIVLFTAFLLEVGARIYFFESDSTVLIPMRNDSFSNFGPWKELPYRVPLKEGRIRRETQEGQVILDAPYSIDSGSRRVSKAPELKPENFLVFIGCSITFGYGVSDYETLPSHVQALTEKYRVYNYGFSGSSPEEVLYRLRNIELNELQETTGRVVYTFFRGHLHRHFRSTEFVGGWGKRRFQYQEKDGKVYNLGSFEKNNPFLSLWYSVIADSRFLRLVRNVFPSKYTEKDHIEFAEFIGRISAEARRLSGKNLLMIVWPQGKASEELIPLFRKNNVDVLDLSHLDLPLLTKGQAHIPIDGHPTSKSYAVIARNLVEYLNSQPE